MAENENAFEYMDDCIHLHACRRYAQRVKQETGKTIGRGCNKACSAYQQDKQKANKEKRTLEDWKKEHPNSVIL